MNLRDVNFKEQTVVGTRVYTKEEFGRAAELTKELETELEKNCNTCCSTERK